MTTIKLEQDENGELVLPLTDDIFAGADWEIGDTILWKDNGDGSWTLSKKPKTKIILVDAIQSYRMRYAVEIPEDAPDEWALDTVTMDEAVEFSQEPLSEQILSHRKVDEEEFLTTFRKDNEYLSTWTDELCFKNALTEWKQNDD